MRATQGQSFIRPFDEGYPIDPRGQCASQALARAGQCRAMTGHDKCLPMLRGCIQRSTKVAMYGSTLIMKENSQNRPLLGWGHQSFWLVGPDAPSVVDAPGWVKTMPNAHNGYYDATLEMVTSDIIWPPLASSLPFTRLGESHTTTPRGVGSALSCPLFYLL
jgi:hypothetical protein